MKYLMRYLLKLRLFLMFVGLAGFFIVERYFGGSERLLLLRVVAIALIGLSCLAPVFGMRGTNASSADKKRWVYPFIWQLIVFVGILLYCAYGKLLGNAAEPTTFVTKILLGGWLSALVIGLFTAVGVEFAFATSGEGQYAEPQRIARSAASWAAIGILTGALVAINYIGAKKNRSYDWSYLKTATPSETTLKILQNLNEPLEIAAFFPVSNEVLMNVRDYFDPIARVGGKITVSYFDRDIQPSAAEKFQTTRNGQVVLLQKGNIERLDVGMNLGSARKTLRNFDQEFQKALLTLTSERKTAYFASGHGEMTWRGKANGEDPLQMLRMLETFLRNQNYSMRFWGAGEGSLKEVPRDASVLVIARNTQPFLEEEVQAIRDYVNRGGSLMVFLDLDGPKEDSLQVSKGRAFSDDPLLKYLESVGVKYMPVPLANTSNYVNATRSPIDAWFLFTNNFASHESIPSLSRNDERIAVLTFKTGYFAVTPELGAWQNAEVIRSLNDTFNDVDKNFKFTEKTTETRNAYPVGVASVQKKDPKDPSKKLGKIISVADSSVISDALLKNPGNLVYFADSFKWLAGDTKTQGNIVTEEDVRIRHTRNEDLAWFYGSVVAVPILILGAGFVATRRTKRRGAA